jgi:hypothetical protein
MQLVAVEARMRHGDSANVQTSANKLKPQKFHGSTSWPAFHCQFEAVTSHNEWTSCEKATHLLAILQGQVADILHSVLARAAYEDIIRALKGCYTDHQLAVGYWVQLKARIQLGSKSLQEFAAATEQLADWALVELPVDFIQREATHAFIDGMRDQELSNWAG